MPPGYTELPRLHTAAEVADALGVTVRYVEDKCRRRLWPHCRLERGRPAFTDAQYQQVLELVVAEPVTEQQTGLAFAPRSRRAS